MVMCAAVFGVYNPEKRSVLDSEPFVVIEILFVQAACSTVHRECKCSFELGYGSNEAVFVMQLLAGKTAMLMELTC